MSEGSIENLQYLARYRGRRGKRKVRGRHSQKKAEWNRK